MRPSVNQVLTGVRGIIENVLLNDLATENSRASAREVIAALYQLEKRWPEVIPNLMKENDDLNALFSSALPLIEEIDQGRHLPAFEHLKQAIERQSKRQSVPEEHYPVYSALEKENDDLRALLVEVIIALEEMKERSADARLEGLKQCIRAHLRKYLDRELEWITTSAYRRP